MHIVAVQLLSCVQLFVTHGLYHDRFLCLGCILLGHSIIVLSERSRHTSCPGLKRKTKVKDPLPKDDSMSKYNVMGFDFYFWHLYLGETYRVTNTEKSELGRSL